MAGWGAAAVLALVAAGTASAQVETVQAGMPLSRVRPTDPAARSLVATARTASPTAARLIDILESSDVIVKVSATLMNDGLAGDTRFLTVTAAVRIVCIRIDRPRPLPERIGWLAHELQHAVEIAGAQEVRSDADLVELMKRIGRSRAWGRLVETDAAVACGRRAEREAAQQSYAAIR